MYSSYRHSVSDGLPYYFEVNIIGQKLHRIP
nr:MAG TPA: hypothetical protein [Caudoviricetes sp.]